ncbi:transposase family protein, partial [Vulcanibacillus modesticaldus]|uniref:transposase family protein n=1 Tax=Vulcanibacillus modesticaldus TaxID=337097 RepID=UPI000B0402D9
MLHTQEDLDMFQEALDIKDPWFVSYKEFNKEQEQLHIYLNFKRGAKFTCPHCGAAHNPVHDIVDKDRTWRHLNFFQYETIIHARLPRIICNSCHKIRSVHV